MRDLAIPSLFLAFMLAGTGALLRASPQETPKKIHVVASVFPLVEFSREVGGRRVSVTQLLPPGGEIHSWQPSPSDIFRLSSADVFLYVGSGLEPWAEDLVKAVRNPRMRVLDISREVSHLLPSGELREDPHIWLDPVVDTDVVRKIADVLSEVDPSHASEYLRNAASYNEKLRALDEKFALGLKKCRQPLIILAGHAAFGHLASRYGLRVKSLYGLSPESRPTARQLIRILEEIRTSSVRIVYADPRLSPDLARVIAAETGARIAVLDPGVSLTRDQIQSRVTFLDIMEKNLEQLRDGLSCR